MYRCRCLQLRKPVLKTVKPKQPAETYTMNWWRLMPEFPKSGAPVPISLAFGLAHSILLVLATPMARVASQAGFTDVGGMSRTVGMIDR